MTRVLQVTALPLTTHLFVVPLARALTDLGYQVELAYGGPEQVDFAPFPGYHIALTRIPFHPVNGQGLWQLVRLMRTRQYDLVHLHTPVAGVVGRLAAHIARVPIVIYTLHGSFWGTQPVWRATLFHGFERCLAPWTSHIFVFNDDDYADLLHRCHLPPEKVTRLAVGGAGVDLALFDPSRFPPEIVAKLRQDLGLGQTDTVIGYVGRIDRDKGIRELLQAFTRLHHSFPQTRLLLVGDRLTGDRDALTSALLTELGPAVICTGFRADVPAMIACMDLVVSPSYRDGFGMILAEAAAMGKAVVATTTRGARSAVVDGVTGLLVPIGDIPALTRATECLITNSALRTQLGRAAQQLAADRFDRRQVMTVYQTTYTRLVRQKVHPLGG